MDHDHALAEEKREVVRNILKRRDAVLENDHFLYTSGKCGDKYVNKDGLYPYVDDTVTLCRFMAEAYVNDGIEVVVGPAVGAVILSFEVARILSGLTARPVLDVYADKLTTDPFKQRYFDLIQQMATRLNTIKQFLHSGDKVVTLDDALDDLETWRTAGLTLKPVDSFALKRGYDELVRGKRTLYVEDVANTGGSLEKAIRAGLDCGAIVVGAACVVNRGGVTAARLGIDRFVSLLEVDFEAHDPQNCPKCQAGIPYNTRIGKGKELGQAVAPAAALPAPTPPAALPAPKPLVTDEPHATLRVTYRSDYEGLENPMDRLEALPEVLSVRSEHPNETDPKLTNRFIVGVVKESAQALIVRLTGWPDIESAEEIVSRAIPRQSLMEEPTGQTS